MLRRLGGILVPILLLASAASGADLKAGVAKVDITPPPGLPMWGYFDRRKPSEGTLDPLYARILVLETDQTRFALVTLDLGRPFGPSSIDRIREAAQKSSGISHLLITASHTHAGPVILDEYPPGQTPAWQTAAEEKIEKAIEEAHTRAQPARLGTGYGVAYIGYNRIRVNPDGSVTMFWTNPTQVPTAPVDPTVAVLRVDTAEGRPLAVLVNYACHAVIFGPDNLQYSADFPGVMTRTVEEAFQKAGRGEPLCFFLQGAPGDINPYNATTPMKEDAIKYRDWTGETLGNAATRVAADIHPTADPAPSLQIDEDRLPFRLRWDPAKLREGLLRSYGADIFKNFAPAIRPEYQLPVTTVLLNRRIALMTMPGEPFVEFQMSWRARCPVPDAFFLGYAGGYYGYFPTLLAATRGGYGAASATTWVEVGAGERMVDHALVRVYEMLGRLSDEPEDLRKPQ